MKTALAVWSLAAAMIGTCAAQEPRSQRFYKDIEPPPLKQEDILATPLDSEVYAAASEGFADLRVTDKSDSEVPYLLEKITESRLNRVRKSAPALDLSLREIKGGGLEIEVSRDERLPPAEGISLITPLTNYQQRVQVLGSSDGQKWEPLVSEALIFDYSRYLDVRNQDIPLPPNRHARFRIVIREVTAEQQSELLELTRKLRLGHEAERVEKVTIQRRPFRIDRIEFWYHLSQQNRKEDKKAAYPVAEFKVEQNPDKHQTLIYVRTRREPLTGFGLQSTSRNFNRRASVEVPMTRGVRTDWREIGRATISQIDFRDLHRQELMIPFPEQRLEDYRLVITNADSPPLAITGVQAEGTVYRVLFLAGPEGGYRLYYGSEVSQAPRYDTAAVSEALGRGYQPVVARLGEQVENPQSTEPPAIRFRGWLNNPILLAVLICLLVVVLAWALYRAGRRIDQAHQEPGAGNA